MSKILFRLLLGGMIFAAGSLAYSQQPWNYTYKVPHVAYTFEFYPADDSYTYLVAVVTEDGTDFALDENADGVYEATYSGQSAGSYHEFSHSSGYGGTLATGAGLRSNKPLQVVLHFVQNDFDTYDSCLMATSLLPTFMWGNQAVIPVASRFIYIYSDQDVQIEINRPGQPAQSEHISERANLRLEDLPPGTGIVAPTPIYILGVNCQPDQNYPWMYNVLPVSLLGSSYYHDTTYEEYDTSWPWPTNPQMLITAVDDGTHVWIDENGDGVPEISQLLGAGGTTGYSDPVKGAHIWSDKKIYAVCVENWSQPNSNKFGGSATEYLPVGLFGLSYALFDLAPTRYLPEDNPRIFISATQDDTEVNVDFGWDGIDIAQITLDKGGFWPVVWPTAPDGTGIGVTARVWSNKKIQVTYRTDLCHTDHPGVCLAYTPIPLDTKIMKDDLVGTWDGQGTYFRNSDSKAWSKLASQARMITVGDLDGDDIGDLIGIWDSPEGLWVRYSSTGRWAGLCFAARSIGSGDMNGDGRNDLLGTWDGQGVFYRDSMTGGWVKLATPAEMVAAGDLDGDGIDDLVGVWASLGGVYVKYSSSGRLTKLASIARHIAAGDMNEDGWDDLVGTWDGQGTFYRDSRTGGWVKLATQAEQVNTGDIDGDRCHDLIGQWAAQGGVWVKYSATASWEGLASPARSIAAGAMRALDSAMQPGLLRVIELPFPMGGDAVGPQKTRGQRILFADGPGGWRFFYRQENNLVPMGRGASEIMRPAGPGERGFVAEEQKNLLPNDRAMKGEPRKKIRREGRPV